MKIVKLEQHRTLWYQGKLLRECTREELMGCIKFLVERNEALGKERKAASLAGIVSGA